MKTSMMMTTALAAVIAAPNVEAKSADAKSSAVQEAVRAFVGGADQQSAEAVSKVLHEQFRVVFSMDGKPGASVLPKAVYLDLLTKKKIGGDERTVTFEWVRVEGDLAYAKTKIDGKKAGFDGIMTLVRHEGAWRIIQDAVVMRVKS